MTLDKIKKKILEWKDFYGGDIADYEKVNRATSKEKLKTILEEHRSFMENMLSDVNSHLNNFERELGLY